MNSMYTVFSKQGCEYCVRAKNLLAKNALPYTEVMCDNLLDLRAKLGPFSPRLLKSFPLIVGPDGKIVGGYAQLRDSFEERVLQNDLGRYSAFPIKNQDIFDAYLKAIATFWTADEISLRQDQTDFQTLSQGERHFLTMILAFFASSDGIVNENLMNHFSNEVQFSESRLFYAYQAFNEAEHNRTYSMLIDALIRDPTERDELFNAIINVPTVQKKAAWALKWLDPQNRRFAERLVAFNCVEGILFSGSFAAIFWLKKQHRGKMPGLSLSNQFIARDEALHCHHAALLYGKLENKLTQYDVEVIVHEAVENEKEFINDAVPCSLIGMNSTLMGQYIEFVADRLLQDLGHSKMYHSDNPFPWMEMISLQGKTNFFENRVSEYSRASVTNSNSTTEFSIDEDF